MKKTETTLHKVSVSEKGHSKDEGRKTSQANRRSHDTAEAVRGSILHHAPKRTLIAGLSIMDLKQHASIAAMAGFNLDDLTPDLHHQPKVAEHRGSQQVAHLQELTHSIADKLSRSTSRVTELLGSIDHRRQTDASHRTQESDDDGHDDIEETRKRSTYTDGDERPSIAKKDSEAGTSLERKETIIDDLDIDADDDEAWNLFLDEVATTDEQLPEDANPLYEMANVDIDVEDALNEMEITLRRSLEQARLTDRERTVLLDKFELFLQSLIAFQQSEVEMIDHLALKNQMLHMLQSLIIEEETKPLGEMFVQQETVTVERKPIEEERDIGDFELESVSGIRQSVGEPKRQPIDKKAHLEGIDEMYATELREQFLVQKNKLEMQEQLKIIHGLEIKQLEFEKTLLTLHYAKMLKPGELQKEMRDLRKAITDMKLEISTMQQEIGQMQLDIAAEDKALHEDEEIITKLELDNLTKQIEFSQNSAKPVHLSKDADKEAHKLEQLQDTLTDLDDKWINGITKYRAYQIRIDQKSTEYSSLLKEEARMVQAKKSSQMETDHVLMDIEALQKKERSLLNKSRTAIERITHNIKVKKKLYEQHHVIYNETTRAVRDFQKLERTGKLASDAHINAKLAYEKMRSAFETAQPKGEAEQWEKLRRMFLHELTHLKGALGRKLDESSVEVSRIANLQRSLNEYYEEQIKCGKELQDVMRITVRKRRERQEKAEQCVKLEGQLYGISVDIRLKKMALDDCGKNERDLNKAMILLQKQYGKVKIEKAAVIGDLIQAKQKIFEQQEKFKIANNELDSYVNQSLDREREITRIHYLLLNAGLARDSMRNDALRAVEKYRFNRGERDEFKLANSSAQKEIARLQLDVAGIRRRFENSVDASVKCATSVREKTEEVCTFIERIQIYDDILLKGTKELRLQEMVRNKLLSTLNEMKTHHFIVVSNAPDENKYVVEVETLRKRVTELTIERRKLEDDVSGINGMVRVREIHHDWMEQRETAPILRRKISVLEGLLAKREIRILERELAMKQLEDLTNSSMEKAARLKAKYENEVKDLVTLRRNLSHLNHRIEGQICEISFARERAQVMETRYKTERTALEKAQRRFDLGLPPTRQMEQEWNRSVWRAEMLRKSNSRTGKFLIEKSRRKGAEIIMERFRFLPKKDICPLQTLIPSLGNEIAVGTKCPKFQYQPKAKCTRQKLSCIKPLVQHLSTGVRPCHT